MTEECTCLKQNPSPGGFGPEVDCPRAVQCREDEGRRITDEINGNPEEVERLRASIRQADNGEAVWRKPDGPSKGLTLYGIPLHLWWDMDEQQRAWARWSWQ